MIYRNTSLAIALCLGLTACVEGFSVGSVGFHRPLSHTVAVPSTCLFAAEEGGGDAEETATEDKAQEETPAGDASSDILNSPAFLQRKLDVIKSDIVKAEEAIDAAKVQLEEGKAEWGKQFEDLEAEVCFCMKWFL